MDIPIRLNHFLKIKRNVDSLLPDQIVFKLFSRSEMECRPNRLTKLFPITIEIKYNNSVKIKYR